MERPQKRTYTQAFPDQSDYEPPDPRWKGEKGQIIMRARGIDIYDPKAIAARSIKTRTRPTLNLSQPDIEILIRKYVEGKRC